MDQISLASADQDPPKSRLQRWSTPSKKPTSEVDIPERKGVWHSIPRIGPRNRSNAKDSTGASKGSPKRPSTPSETNGHETELHISPPPRSTANSSTSPFHKFRSKTRSRLPSSRHEGKPSEPAQKIEACEGDSVASRHNIGTASIDCEFYKIEYGQFKERPACLIIVDVQLTYPPDNTINGAKLEFQFAKDGGQNPSPEDDNWAPNSQVPISKVFAPVTLEGMPTCVKKTTHQIIRPNIEGLSFKIGSGGGGVETTAVKEHRWRVLGRMEKHHGIYDTFGWQIFQNEASEDSVPRQLRLGMIAFHQHEPFSLNVHIEGSTRQKHWRLKPTQEKRWFNPPDSDDVGHHVLQESMVDNLVSRQNRLIRDIAQSRNIEGPTMNLMDITGFGGGAGMDANGVGAISDLLSLGEIGLTADSPTGVLDSDSCT